MIMDVTFFPVCVQKRFCEKDASGNVEKSRQRRSRHFAVLTYYEYAPRVKMAAALLDRPFGKTQGMLF